MMFFTLAIAPIYYKNQRNKRKPPELQSKGTGLGRLWGGIMLGCWIGLMVLFVTTGTTNQGTDPRTDDQIGKSSPADGDESNGLDDEIGAVVIAPPPGPGMAPTYS
jgi:hypothetical protein